MKQTFGWLSQENCSIFLLYAVLSVLALIVVFGLAHRWALVSTPTLMIFSTVLWLLSVVLLVLSLAIIGFCKYNANFLSTKVIQAAMLSLVIVVIPPYLLWISRNLPAINDISTDIHDPPLFDVVKALRPEGANSTDYTAKIQALGEQGAYVGIYSAVIDQPPKILFPVILGLVRKREWVVLDTILPAGSGTEGKIEATSFSPWLRFADDIVIRIRRYGTNSRVDIRSASRYGVHDFGTNAERVRSFLAELSAIK